MAPTGPAHPALSTGSAGPAPLPVATPAAPSTSAVERFLGKRDWKFYLAVALPPLVLASLGAWYYSSTRPSASKKSRSKKRSKKSNTGGAPKPDLSASDLSDDSTAPTLASSIDGSDVIDPATMDAAAIAALPKTQREELATSLKTKGNKYYAGRNYRKAIALYTQALKFKEDPVYYANRAACHNELGDHTKTIDDCNSAIKLNPTYVKALARRASAYEKMDEYRAALDDFTTACILDKFKNQSWAMAAERMARRHAEGEAKKIFANRTPRLPSRSFINAFLSSYRPDPALASPPENLSECTVGEQAFWKAVASLNDHQYAQALTSINEAIDNGCGAWEAKALNIRGTFAFLMGDNDKALRDLNRSIELNPNDPQAYLKKANTLTDCQRIAETVQTIDDASNISNVDQTEVHYQKGQVFFLSNEFMHAIDEFSRAIESDPTFVYPYIQKAVCQYKNGDITGSDATFKDAIARFPQSSDVYNHYGEVLVDRQMFDEGAQAFDKAIEVDSMQPMAALNKAILVLQWKQDPTAAMDLVDLALKRDPECEMANATASQICIHAMRFDEALHYLNKAVESGKSENEIMQAVLLRETTRAQLEAIKDNPDTMAQMFAAASGM